MSIDLVWTSIVVVGEMVHCMFVHNPVFAPPQMASTATFSPFTRFQSVHTYRAD